MNRARTPALLALPLALAACGARSSLGSLAGATGAGGATTTSTTATGAGGATTSPTTTTTTTTPGTGGAGGQAPACDRWVALGAPVALTDPIGDSMLTSVVVDGHDVFVASMNNNGPSPDPTWRVRVVKDDLGAIGPSQMVLAHPQNVSYGGLSLAVGAHRGGVAWHEGGGCRFVALAADGAPAAPPVKLGGDYCFWLSPTAGGFVAFESPAFAFTPLSLLTLGPDGALLDRRPGLIPDQGPSSWPLGRARLADGSFFLAWRVGAEVFAARVTETGDPATPPTPLLGLADDGRFAIASLGGSALVAFSPHGEEGEVFTATLGADGILGPSTLLAATGAEVYRLAVGAVAGGAIVAWSAMTDADDHAVAQPVDASGIAHGDAVILAAPPRPFELRVAGTPAGAMIVFDGQVPGTLTQVFAARLACE